MKTLIPLLLLLLLVSCSAPVAEQPTPSALPESTLPILTDTLLPNPSNTPTAQPSSTITPPPPATNTPTPTPLPTLDPSFLNIAACLPKNSLIQVGTVTEVIDGDTVVVRLEDGKLYTVRYIGIDSPERDMPFFSEAYNANADWVLDQEVILVRDVSETDRYDRLLRYVLVGDHFVNLELIRAGVAQAMRFPPDISCADAFTAAEGDARDAQIGLWSASSPPGLSAFKVVIIAVDKRLEYVDIQNQGIGDVDLTGWNLVSERGHQECPLSGTLKTGETLRVWSGTAQAGGFGCGYNSPIWNNSEADPAVLYDPQGLEVSRK